MRALVRDSNAASDTFMRCLAIVPVLVDPIQLVSDGLQLLGNFVQQEAREAQTAEDGEAEENHRAAHRRPPTLPLLKLRLGVL